MRRMKAKSGPASAAKRSRPATVESRERLLHAALRLFAAQGFAKTSIREIASTAGVNIAAISYYFGDKAGLYRTLFTESLGCPATAFSQADHSTMTLREALSSVLLGFLDLLKQDELVQLGTRLHFREMIEPTGMREEKIDTGIRPAHAMLVKLLSRALGLVRADDGVHRLAFSIIGLGVQMFLTRDVIQAIRPQLLATPAAIDTWAARMVDYAEAMVAVEAQRRVPSPGRVPKIAVRKKP